MNTASGRKGTAEIVALGEERSRRAALGVDAATADPALDSAGAMLRAVREDAGYSLEEVSEEINVKQERLAAIEAMALGALPSAPYTLGFVRAYAGFVGLPVEPLVARFREEAGWTRSATAPVVKAPPRPSRDREIGLFGVVVVALFIIWAIWQIIGKTPDADEGAALPAGFPIADRTARVEVVPEVTTSLEDDLALSPKLETPDAAGVAATDAGGAAADSLASEPAMLPSGPVAEAARAADPTEAPRQAARFSLVATPLASPLVTSDRDRPEPRPAATPTVTRADRLNEQLLREVMAESEPAASPTPVPERAPDRAAPSVAAPTPSAPARSGVVAEAAPTVAAPSDTRVAALLTSPVSPVYPRRCQSRAAEEEVVLVRFGVSRFGRVIGPAVETTTNSCFNDAALSAVSRFGFDPATEGGRTVATSGRTTRIVFRKP